MKRRPDPAAGVIPTIDRLVETRYDSAVALVRKIAARPDVTSRDQVVDELVKRYTKELAAVAAISGGTAAMPAAGTATALAATGVDLAYTISRLGEMILAIGIANGHDSASIAERKAWVLAVLSRGRGAASRVEGLAGTIGAEGGARLIKMINASQLDTVNSKLASKMLARVATEQSAARLGRLLPFGIGAGVGAAGNVMIVRSVAKSARLFFADPDGPTIAGASTTQRVVVDPDVIDVDSTEVR